MKTFCTIVTADYLPFAKVLYNSLQKNVPGTTLQVLVIDKNNFPSSDTFIIHTIASIAHTSFFKEIEKKYAHTNDSHHFRWALKPVFINYLLEHTFQQVIYVDPDIFFCGNFSFLFEKLEKSAVLLTPHWRDSDPLVNEENFLAVFKDGLYNAGFIGASEKGIAAIKWWAGLCHYKMERNKDKGLFDDQRYLNAMPVEFSEVETIRHKGCNLSYWNINSCKREIVNGKLLINGQYEPIFIHFTEDTIINILNKNDHLLKPCLDEYEESLKEQGVDIENWWKDLSLKKYNTAFYKIKHKIRLRTRIKRFFFKLAEKI